MVVLENRLFLNGIVYAVLHLVVRFFRLEVHKTACVPVSYTHLDVYKRQS